jgi:hypothetical protein
MDMSVYTWGLYLYNTQHYPAPISIYFDDFLFFFPTLKILLSQY